MLRAKKMSPKVSFLMNSRLPHIKQTHSHIQENQPQEEIAPQNNRAIHQSNLPTDMQTS